MLLSLILVLSGSAAQALTSPSLKPSWEEFRHFCQIHRSQQASPLSTTLKMGDVRFVGVQNLEATQTRFSFDRFKESLVKAAKKAEIGEAELAAGWFPHNNGTSLYPIERATAGILYRGKIYITDGHHRALISTFAGASTIPVQIIGVVPDQVSPQRFFHDLASKNLSYYKDYTGRAVAPLDLCEMEDDPFLLLARLLLLRVDLTYDNGRITILDVRGKHIPLAIKVNRDIPFLEFELADALRRGGAEWHPGMELTPKKLKAFLAILKEARDGSRLSQVLLLSRPARMAKPKIAKTVSRFLKVNPCEYKLMASDKD